MFIIVSGHVNGRVDYIGPFPSLNSAVEYGKNHPSCRRLGGMQLRSAYRQRLLRVLSGL